MKLTQVDVKNFRLLHDVSVRLSDPGSSTILVGPNNCGKTSLIESLLIFTNGSAKAFSISDFSISCKDEFDKVDAAFVAEQAASVPADPAPALPTMAITLLLEYSDKAEDLVVASDLLMDLDPASRSVALSIELAPVDASKLAHDFRARSDAKESLYEFLRLHLSDHYGLSYYKVAVSGGQREKLADGGIVGRIIHVSYVSAQRHIDDQESAQATRLSRLLHLHYARRYKADDPGGHKELEEALRKHSVDLTGRYVKAFQGLLTGLGQFGYPQRHSPRLSVRAELDSATLFKDNTRIYYTPRSPDNAEESKPAPFELPEKYNGLGFKNLIYMVLQVKAFREEFEAIEHTRPRVHLIVIEEPEVHLHPQVQSVFIRQMSPFLKSVTGTDTAQLVLTTHSSHIVADCGFVPVRYFRRHGNLCVVKDLLEFQSAATKAGEATALKFLAQYLTQTRCDLLFADKAILVEGPSERLLLPRMVLQLANKEDASLVTDYVVTLEVGGAYAHLFRPLLQFLELPTLVITDLDSIGEDRQKCPVVSGVKSSNATLTKWLPGKALLADLAKATPTAKTSGVIRVAYQVPESPSEPCGRSFEEAFVYANAGWLALNSATLAGSADEFSGATASDISAQAYDIATVRLQKVDFALDLMVADGWKTPRYIAEGLSWLAEQQV
jgi:putative ATP-dependent endonuclease of the OLD family